MKHIRYIWFVMLAALIATSCGEDKIETYDNNATGIFFLRGWKTMLYGNTEQYTDSTDFSFSVVSDDVRDTVLTTTLTTLGFVKDYDRKVRVVVDKERSTAIEGVNYEINLDTIQVKAGTSKAYVSVRFLRTADLADQRIRLVLKVEDNDNFTVPFEKQLNTNVYSASDVKIDANRFTFIVSEIYTQPSYWQFASDTFGAWSVAKMKYVNKVCDIPIEDWQRGGYNDSKVSAGRFPIYGYKVRNALQKAADEGNPVKDDDGSYMQLGDNYKVDYSAYNVR